MNRTALVALALASALTTSQLALAAVQTQPSAPVEAMLRPGAGRASLMIRTTRPRRVLLHASAIPGLAGGAHDTLQEVCTTPCRIYVAPGVVHVTLVGTGAHEYEWEVPATGGSVSLLSRAPDGTLDPLPPEHADERGESRAAHARAATPPSAM